VEGWGKREEEMVGARWGEEGRGRKVGGGRWGEEDGGGRRESYRGVGDGRRREKKVAWTRSMGSERAEFE